MRSKLLSLFVASLVCAMLMLVSCESVTVGRKPRPKRGHGPPPHAPAHGYRQEYHGVELVFDSGCGVYVVVGLPSHYYYKGHFYRFYGGQWQVSVEIGGPWNPVSEASLPPGLRGKERAKGRPKERPGRGRGTQ
jgi:hypothetical protein